jgi:cell division protein FtsW
MDSLLKRYLKGDATIWMVFAMLCIVSIIEMYSASSQLAYSAESHTAPMLRHVGFLALGAILAVIVHVIPYRFIRLFAYVGLILSFFLLIFVLLKGEKSNDASRWLTIFGFKFQPSELAKISVIVVAADFISRIKNHKTDEKKYFWSTILMLAVICPLILLENFSTAFVLFGVVMLMMFIGKVSLIRLSLLGVSLVFMLVMGYTFVKNVPKESMPKFFDRSYTWVGRIDRFTEEKDKTQKYVITDENLQEQHGKIAIARGGFFGLGPGNSIQRDYLPQAYSDFIYAIIVEETGLIGGVFVILLYLILLFRAGKIATESPSVFPAVLVIGLSLMIVIQTFVSMSVATSLGPVTGQPLPLISRGGTSTLITCIYFGIILGITSQIKQKEDKTVNNMDEKREENIPVVNIAEI